MPSYWQHRRLSSWRRKNIVLKFRTGPGRRGERWLEGEISDGDFWDALAILSRSELVRDDIPGSMNVPATDAGTASVAAPLTPRVIEWIETRTGVVAGWEDHRRAVCELRISF